MSSKLVTLEEIKSKSPSLRDNIDWATETKYRERSAHFIKEAGVRLESPQLAIATATVLFHKFFRVQSFKRHDRFIVATASLFLACKIEDTPRKLHDVIKVTYRLKHQGKPPPGLETKEYFELKEQVLMAEARVLHAIAFELNFDHPYRYLMKFLKPLGVSADKEQRHKFAQAGWSFANDSLRTTVSLQFHPRVIAAATLYLATKFLNDDADSKEEIPQDHKDLWLKYGIKPSDVDEIAKQILDLYDKNDKREGN